MTNLYAFTPPQTRNKGMSKIQAHSYVVDAADCLLNAHETLVTVAKKCPSLASDLEFIQAKVLSLKNELVNQAGLIHANSASFPNESETLTALPWNMQMQAAG